MTDGQGQKQARHAYQEKGWPPAKVFADEAPHQVGKSCTQRDGQVQDPHIPGAARQGLDVRQVGRCQGAERGLSHPHESPGENQGGIGCHPESQAGGQAPERGASSHEEVSAVSVPQVSEHRRSNEIDQQEGRVEQAEGCVTYTQICLNQAPQGGHQVAVQVVQQVKV